MSPNDKLRIVSRIYVLTANGEREIQLCIGDITQLPVEDKVDVIIVSAFPDDYSPVPGTVICALLNKLGINVRKLAKSSRREDLRSQFSCWVSEPLEEHLPFRQLLCFERSRYGDVDLLKSVKKIFRAMMPIFNNRNKSVITPLLATGCQMVDECKMLRRMVESTINWMNMGLPLQTMKIVIYSSNPHKPGPDQQACITLFDTLKKKTESASNIIKEPAIVYDIYLVYSDADGEVANFVAQSFKSLKKSITLVSSRDMETKEETWQHDVFLAMISSTRIVPLLTEHFLESVLCVDQYNIALCCNRWTHRHIMAPLRLAQNALPLYMGMVQWIHCGSDKLNIQHACGSLLNQSSLAQNSKQRDGQKYDVFLSYSHKNMTEAKMLLDTLQKMDRKLKVFFDYDALKTGVLWQQTLYHAIDESKCVIALVSEQYLQSDVCTEEFNLALARHMEKETELTLVPVCLQPVKLLQMNKELTTVEMIGDNREKTAHNICREVLKWLKTGKNTKMINNKSDPVSIDDISRNRRQLLFKKHYTFSDGNVAMFDGEKSSGPVSETKTQGCDIYISHIVSDQRYSTFLTKMLKHKRPCTNIKSPTASTNDDVALIESAKYLVVLLSSGYIQSKKEVEQFQLMLSRQRSSKKHNLMYVIWLEDLPPKPTYFHLVLCDTCLSDDIWQTMINGRKDKCLLHRSLQPLRASTESEHGALADTEVVALLKAACDIAYILDSGRCAHIISAEDAILQNVMRLRIGDERT